MNNFVYLLISAMAHAGIFTKEEAESLCQEMQYSTLPDSFEAAYNHVEKIFQKADVGKKVNTSLEGQVAELRTEINSIKTPQMIAHIKANTPVTTENQ